MRRTTARSRDCRRNSVAMTWRATPTSQAPGEPRSGRYVDGGVDRREEHLGGQVGGELRIGDPTGDEALHRLEVFAVEGLEGVRIRGDRADVRRWGLSCLSLVAAGLRRYIPHSAIRLRGRLGTVSLPGAWWPPQPR